MPSIKPEPVDRPGLGVDAAVGHVHNAQNAGDSGDTSNPIKVGYLQRLLASPNSPELLEQGVTIGVRFLESLKEPLEAVAPLNQTQASQWLKSIGDLEALAKPTRTIVGVVGNTGAGKSSVISAVLDEERYVLSNAFS
jgi:hypothetical protein